MSRNYRLSPEGLASLRQAIRRTRPWERRTPEGLRRAARNSLKTGEHTAEAIAARRFGNARRTWGRAVMVLLSMELRRKCRAVGIAPPGMPGCAPHRRADDLLPICVRRAERWARQAARYGPDDDVTMLDFADQAARWMADRGMESPSADER